MKIDKVVVACYIKDLPLARTCVASIRYWYPDVDIYLLKDERQGKFSTLEIENCFGAKVLRTPGKYSGWGTAKFEVLFTELDRFLLLDADTLFLGRVLDDLAQFDDNFIVTGISTAPGEDCEPEWLIARDYIDFKRMLELDPDYKCPGYGVNTGQVVITTGKITMEWLDQFLEFPGGKLKPIYEHVFRYADQGLLNYFLAKLSQNRSATVRYHPFWLWPGIPKAERISLESIKNRTSPALVLHWAGIKSISRKKYPRYDILRFFEDYYYTRIPHGSLTKSCRRGVELGIMAAKIIKHKLLREKYF
jgi:lipopolysaccharide biosynthesis glycosyltransferase